MEGYVGDIPTYPNNGHNVALRTFMELEKVPTLPSGLLAQLRCTRKGQYQVIDRQIVTIPTIPN